ncbi:hypothetical protein ACLB2K_006034 [Fragaria x ananassa]
MAPTPLTAESAHEFKSKMLGLKPHDFATKSSLKLFNDATTGLGPWMDPIPPSISKDYQHATRVPTLAFRNSAANFRKWQISHQSVRIRVWPYPSACMNLWYQKRKALDLRDGSRRDTSSNTFNFRFGQMGITLLDLYAIIGLPVSNKPYQEIDFEEEAVAFEADLNRHNFFCTSTQMITDAWVRAATLLFNGHKNLQITDFSDNQVLGMVFARAKAYDSLDYSDCFQHLYILDVSALDASELMLN